MVLHGGAWAAAAALQEAPFACFEDEGIDASNTAFGAFNGQRNSHSGARTLPTHVVAAPGGNKALPARGVARLRALECSGSGTFYFRNEALQHRFLCWRITKNVVVLREWSLHASLPSNGLRLQLPAAVVASGVAAWEPWDSNAVIISVLTHAGSIHRFTFPIRTDKASGKTASIFQSPQDNTPVFPGASTAFFHTATHVVTSLQAEEAITTALWVNELNLIVATDAGRMLGVNFGLPSNSMSLVNEQAPQEFIFSDESMVQWLWNGLVKKTKRPGSANGSGEDLSANAIVAMTSFPLMDNESDEEDGEQGIDVCILTLSADFTLRAWSFSNQTCLGKQSISSLVRTTDPDNEDVDDFDNEDGSAAYATQAKIVAIPSSTSGACRLLVHVESTEDYPQQVVLLRGEIDNNVAAASSSNELALDVARVFRVGSNHGDKQRLKFVDFAVEKGFLYSAWRSSRGDFVYSHANPMALTGPRVIPAQLVSSVDVQMKKYEQEDAVFPFQLSDDENANAQLIDNYYAERVLLPGRFSRQSLYKAISEYHGGLEAPLRAYFTQVGPQESRYKEMLVGVVGDKWLQSSSAGASARAARIIGQQHPSAQRMSIWKAVIELCTKHWRNEVAPIGFATSNNATSLGSPVLLRRNRISLFFPSAVSITSTMLSTSTTPSAAAAREIVADVLPAYDAFPSASFQATVQNEVTAIMSGDDWKVESLIPLARQSVRLAMQTTPSIAGELLPEVVLTRSLLRLSQALGNDASHHVQVLQDLVDSLSPAHVALGESSDDPFAVNSDAEEGNERDGNGDDQMNGGDSASSSGSQFFAANELCYALSQVTARTVDSLCAQALRVVLCLAHLVDAKPTFIEAETLKSIERKLLPKAIVVYQRWSQSRWLANQNITSTTEIDLLSAKTSGTLLPPLLQFFLAEANDSLNRVEAFQRVRSTVDYGDEDTHALLGSFASGILELISRPNDLLVAFLQKKREYSILRSMLSCSLNDLSLQHESAIPLKSHIRVKYIRSIGECLAWEGYQASTKKNVDERVAAAASNEYFKQAVRCFNMCLSSYVAQIESSEEDRDQTARAIDDCERFVGTAVRLLKETVPRGSYQLTLRFLWVIASEALELVDSKALQSFVWVNIFKYSVEVLEFHDAHLALMRTVQLSTLSQGFEGEHRSSEDENDVDTDIARTAVECTSYFVKELCRHGRLDLVCDFQWAALESEVEQQIQWLAANANVVKDGAVDPNVVMYHQLVYAFFARRNQPANAAAAMHSLYLRLRLADSAIKSARSLRTQRNALLAALNVLLELNDEENRWVVRKLHTEELLDKTKPKTKPTAKQIASLHIVTYKDMERELAVLDGKLRLLEVGLEESVLLSTMDASDVVMLLVDAAMRLSFSTDASAIATLSEKKQESLVSLELAVQIAAKSSLPYDHMTKSLARFCVSNAQSFGVDHLAWELLKTYLRFVDELKQFEIAAQEILSWQSFKIVLPEWITQRLSCTRTGNAAKLVLLYMKHGLLIEATQTAAAMVPVDIIKEGEAAFHKRSNAPSASLPWLPYNLFDALLNADDAALTSTSGSAATGGFGFSGASAASGDPALRAAAQELRSRLVEYFKYVNTQDLARQAASVTRNTFASL